MASRSRICSGENIRAGPLWFCILEFIILSEESQWKGRVCNITVIFLCNQVGDTIIFTYVGGTHPFSVGPPRPHTPTFSGPSAPYPFRGGSTPTPRVTFPSPEKSPKGRIGGGHFRLCPPPKDHPPQRPMRGLRPPLWILPRTVLWTARGPLKISLARAE